MVRAGCFTRTTPKKLQLTKVPEFVPVDLAPLAALEAELDEVRRKIQLTDDLIDQIVYTLYGLTEQEIAIVAGGHRWRPILRLNSGQAYSGSCWPATRASSSNSRVPMSGLGKGENRSTCYYPTDKWKDILKNG